MKKQLTSLFLATTVLAATPALARDIEVEITNLTNGIYFTPLLVAAHGEEEHLFQAGTEASDALQAMAEGGDLSGLIDELDENDSEYRANPAAGLLAPGQTTSAEFDLQRHHRLRISVVAMMLPTNDGFVGLDAIGIPKRRGTYTYYLNGYDAGTEANDEIVNGGGMPGVPGIPADPGGAAGSAATGAAAATENDQVHIHPGTIGDMDPAGGISDLDNRVHRWLNPVARVVLKVK